MPLSSDTYILVLLVVAVVVALDSHHNSQKNEEERTLSESYFLRFGIYKKIFLARGQLSE